MFFGCYASHKKNDLIRENLADRVKSVKQTYYYADEKFGEVMKGDPIIHLFNNYQNFYDKNGNLVEIDNFSSGDYQMKTTIT